MRSTNIRTQYFVEGECEKKLIRTLIEQKLILPGQTDVLNPIQAHIKTTHLRTLPIKARIILVFYTDMTELRILEQNIRYLRAQHNKEIITIPQVLNLEDEMIRCTDIRYIRNLLSCTHDSDFKTAFIEERKLYDKLLFHQFDLKKLWSLDPPPAFQKIGIANQSDLIRL